MHGRYGDMIAMMDQYLDGREELTPEMFYYENINRAYGINRLDPINTRELKLDVSRLMAGIYLLESILDRKRTFQKIVIN